MVLIQDNHSIQDYERALSDCLETINMTPDFFYLSSLISYLRPCYQSYKDTLTITEKMSSYYKIFKELKIRRKAFMLGDLSRYNIEVIEELMKEF